MARPITRRRAIGITAAAAGLALLPAHGALPAERARPADDAAAVARWRGLVLGAPASLVVHHPSRSEAERLVRASVAEIVRLERIFSLYRPDSALVELNRRGVLVAPPAELVALLQTALACADLTRGVFDPTVQPLWQLHATHFASAGADPAGPPPAALERALSRVGYRHLLVGRDRIAFARRGMAITLNGIAQGSITDRVVNLLRAGGVERCLADLGEVRALGDAAPRRPWHVGIAGSAAASTPPVVLDIIDQAVATSSGGGCRFDAAGRFNHIFDPRSGHSADPHRSVTVVMPTATAADALSTAASLMPREAARALVRGPGVSPAGRILFS
jgi:thiamine biosynthesis lipoprotein